MFFIAFALTAAALICLPGLNLTIIRSVVISPVSRANDALMENTKIKGITKKNVIICNY